MRVVSTGSIIVRNGLQLQILHKANSFSFTLAMEAERRRRLVLSVPSCASVITGSHLEVCDVSSKEAEEANGRKTERSVHRPFPLPLSIRLCFRLRCHWFTLKRKDSSFSASVYASASVVSVEEGEGIVVYPAAFHDIWNNAIRLLAVNYQCSQFRNAATLSRKWKVLLYHFSSFYLFM